MKVQDVKRDTFREICDTFRLLYCFLKIFALNCILTVGVSRLNLIRMATSAIIVASFNLYILIYKFLYLINVRIQVDLSIQYTDAVQSVYDLIQYFVDLWYVYKYGADICLEYLNRYCCMDSLLGMEYYAVIKTDSTKFLCYIISLWFTTSLFDYSVWASGLGLMLPLYFSPAYVHMLIKLLTSVYLSLHIMHIESRLRTIGDHVQKLYTISDDIHPLGQEVLSSTWFCPYSISSASTAVEFSNAKNNVKWFSCYYLLLSEQVKFINRMFGMRILLNTLSLLIEMVRLINIAVRIICGSQHTGSSFYPAIGSLVKVLMCAILLISVVCRSEKAYEQRSRLLCLIDNLLVNKKIDKNIVDDIKDFRCLVQARPVSFSMASFVRIDNSFLVSIASAVVTYSIILLQSVS